MKKSDAISEACHLATCPNYCYLGHCVHAPASSQTERMLIACAHRTVDAGGDFGKTLAVTPKR